MPQRFSFHRYHNHSMIEESTAELSNVYSAVAHATRETRNLARDGALQVGFMLVQRIEITDEDENYIGSVHLDVAA